MPSLVHGSLRRVFSGLRQVGSLQIVMFALQQTECWRPGSAHSRDESHFVTLMNSNQCHGCLRILNRLLALYWPFEEAVHET